MYFMDFLKLPMLQPNVRYFLSGDNGFLKSFAMSRIGALSGRALQHVSSVKEIQPDDGLFNSPVVYILGSKSNPKKFQDFTIKLSGSPMGKTYKDAGFTEVSCSNLFPSQAKQLGAHLAEQAGLKRTLGSKVAEALKFDPYSIFNAIQLLSYLGDKEIQQYGLDNLVSYLGTPDTYKVIDMFIEGQYSDFIYHVKSNPNSIHEILWSLMGAVLKLQKSYADATFAVTWYQKKLLSSAERLAPYQFSKIIAYINNLCNSYSDSYQVLLLRLQRLVLYLQGHPVSL